jgi:hypothetical protein
MPALNCDFFDETFNPISGCMYPTDECKNCFQPYFQKSHTHGIETVHTGVIDINDEGLPFWNGRLKTLRDGHHEWNFPLKYHGAEHPGKPSLILVGATGDLFMKRRPPKTIDRVVETIALSPHIGPVPLQVHRPRVQGPDG